MDISSNKQKKSHTGKLGHDYETEYLLKAAQNNVIRTNYIKVRIEKTSQNSKCTLFCDRNETINSIIDQ